MQACLCAAAACLITMLARFGYATYLEFLKQNKKYYSNYGMSTRLWIGGEGHGVRMRAKRKMSDRSCNAGFGKCGWNALIFGANGPGQATPADGKNTEFGQL